MPVILVINSLLLLLLLCVAVVVVVIALFQPEHFLNRLLKASQFVVKDGI